MYGDFEVGSHRLADIHEALNVPVELFIRHPAVQIRPARARGRLKHFAAVHFWTEPLM